VPALEDALDAEALPFPCGLGSSNQCAAAIGIHAVINGIAVERSLNDLDFVAARFEAFPRLLPLNSCSGTFIRMRFQDEQ
jgi:hypothetical protein